MEIKNIRHIVWFSCGAASTITAHLVLKEHPESQLVYCNTRGEHKDNERFLAQVEGWLSKKVIVLQNGQHENHFDVYRKTRFLNSPRGARCTAELKKSLRYKYQRPDDIQYFGYTFDEQDRADTFTRMFPEVNAKFPLIEHQLDKKQCVAILRETGIELPMMYRLGFHNNNCIGCVKGGKGYWNKIRKVFPEHFNEMASIEREIGATAINGVYLDELNPKAGRHKDLQITCDFTCAAYTVGGQK